MVARDRFAIEVRGDERVIVEHVFEPDVARVTVVALEEDVFRFRSWPDKIDNCEEGDAAPAAIEFAPGGDAMEIGDVFKLWELVEFFPRECLRMLDEPSHFEAPIAERNLRPDAEIENGEAGREVLAGRETILRTRGRLRFAAHFARPTFFALDQARVRFVHGKK